MHPRPKTGSLRRHWAKFPKARNAYKYEGIWYAKLGSSPRDCPGPFPRKDALSVLVVIPVSFEQRARGQGASCLLQKGYGRMHASA